MFYIASDNKDIKKNADNQKRACYTLKNKTMETSFIVHSRLAQFSGYGLNNISDSTKGFKMRFAHTNIASRDWKKLADFYINVFDCKIKPPQRNLSGKWLDTATGLTNAKLEGIHLLLPGHGENPPTLEIFTYEKMRNAPDIMPNSLCITHIAFEVEDVNITLKKAQAS